MAFNVGNLEVYDIALKLCLEIYQITIDFPKEEKYGIVSQVRRASSSIGANIAEGSGRYHYLDRRRFYFNARASLYEVYFFLELSEKLEYITKKERTDLVKAIQNLSVKLNNLIKYLEKMQNKSS